MMLSKAIEQFTDFRSSLGVGSKDKGYLKRFMENVGDVNIEKISEAQVQTFLLGSGPLTKSYVSRHATMSMFYKYVTARGYCAVSPMPKVIPKIQSSFTPYIYSKEELKRLLAATDQIDSPKGVLDPLTFRVLLLLLYGAMLRISEAVSLNVADVDLNGGLLTINESKFYKTRIVPVGAQLKTAILDYARTRKLKSSERFFLNRRGEELKRPTVEENFYRLREAAGVSRNDGYFPRLHDLRHTGAVHRVIDWYQKGKDVQKLLPLLSTYMGHVDLRCTQVYLTVTPEIMQSAGFKFEQYAFGEVAP
jgi:integrase/recombinase XerD